MTRETNLLTGFGPGDTMPVYAAWLARGSREGAGSSSEWGDLAFLRFVATPIAQPYAACLT
jgi:hypothetical protein